MQINASSATGATSNATAGSNTRIGLADNFDSFLQLLTAQLKSQDPLSPLDATKFTEQLVQFSGVEQAIKTNDTLGQLVALMRTDQISRSVDYLDAEVEAPGQTVRLDGAGSAQVYYQLGRAASDVQISIYNEAGQRVAAFQGAGSEGRHNVPWDGRNQGGAPLPHGLYRVEIEAKDATGEAVPVGTTLRGLVDGVEIAGDRLLLSVEGVLLPLDSVTAIRRPQAGA